MKTLEVLHTLCSLSFIRIGAVSWDWKGKIRLDRQTHAVNYGSVIQRCMMHRKLGAGEGLFGPCGCVAFNIINLNLLIIRQQPQVNWTNNIFWTRTKWPSWNSPTRVMLPLGQYEDHYYVGCRRPWLPSRMKSADCLSEKQCATHFISGSFFYLHHSLPVYCVIDK